ncbi:hypothetical protein BAMA_18435 [Bacillus manliponensis]|uniref:Uncharacterized protein n=1 Tax=Bacillus manliponensis TaxID=574376 RepID=A0A073JS20_9BACI|nr:hypothetical protein [Bacillus manliponensis]KEK17120.1 hypothetical protein BAMA_18435 [Bacillus manliponensis]
MPFLGSHGIGKKKMRRFEVVEAVDKLQFPIVRSMVLRSSHRYVGVDLYKKKYIFQCTAITEYRSYFYVYKMNDFSRVKEFELPFEYQNFYKAFVVDNLLFVCGYDANLNDRYERTFVYDMNTWVEVASFTCAVSEVISVDENNIYALTVSPGDGSSSFTVISRKGYTQTKLKPPGVNSPQYTILKPTNYVYYYDFYDRSKKGILSPSGVLVNNNPDDRFTNAQAVALNGEMLYLFSYSYVSERLNYLIKVSYFDKNFNFIKQESLNTTIDISPIWSMAYIHNKGSTMTVGGYGLGSFKLENGFFADGTATYGKRKATFIGGSLLHAYDDGYGAVFIVRDETEIKAVKSYVDLA